MSSDSEISEHVFIPESPVPLTNESPLCSNGDANDGYPHSNDSPLIQGGTLLHHDGAPLVDPETSDGGSLSESPMSPLSPMSSFRSVSNRLIDSTSPLSNTYAQQVLPFEVTIELPSREHVPVLVTCPPKTTYQGMLTHVNEQILAQLVNPDTRAGPSNLWYATAAVDAGRQTAYPPLTIPKHPDRRLVCKIRSKRLVFYGTNE